MGVSTDAIPAFGFDLGDEEDSSLASRFGEPEKGDDEESFDFDEWIARKAGAIYPVGHSGIKSPKYEEYWAKRNAAIAACPVEVITHCSYDYPMYFLAIRGSESRARRGYPQRVADSDPSPEMIIAMRSFCDVHGIAWQEPAWHIFSMWG